MDKQQKIPSRQIHLDFHTSEKIEEVCKEFDAEEFATTLNLKSRKFIPMLVE